MLNLGELPESPGLLPGVHFRAWKGRACGNRRKGESTIRMSHSRGAWFLFEIFWGNKAGPGRQSFQIERQDIMTRRCCFCKRQVTLAVCILASVFSFGFRPETPPALRSPEQAISSIPDHVIYESFFRRLVYLDAQATKLEQHGQNGDRLRNLLINKVGIDLESGDYLREMAQATLNRVAELDRIAFEIIKQERAKYTNAIAEYQGRPKTPPILKALQQERDAVFKDAIDMVKSHLGDSYFAYLDERLKQALAGEIEINPERIRNIRETIKALRARNP